MSFATKRLSKELIKLQTGQLPPGITLVSADNFEEWQMDIKVMDDNPLYRNQTYTLKFMFSKSYPIGKNPPEPTGSPTWRSLWRSAGSQDLRPDPSRSKPRLMSKHRTQTGGLTTTQSRPKSYSKTPPTDPCPSTRTSTPTDTSAWTYWGPKAGRRCRTWRAYA